MLMTRNEFLCYDCNRQTKSKLRDENKTKIFYGCLAISLDEKWTEKETESIFYYGCII